MAHHKDDRIHQIIPAPAGLRAFFAEWDEQKQQGWNWVEPVLCLALQGSGDFRFVTACCLGDPDTNIIEPCDETSSDQFVCLVLPGVSIPYGAELDKIYASRKERAASKYLDRIQEACGGSDDNQC